MCFIRNNRIAGIEPERYVSYAKEAVKHGLLELTLTGGEVFTRADFFDIYNPIYDLGVILSIMTNGYLLSKEEINTLKIRKPHNVYITLYGASDSTYMRICGKSDGFSVVKKHIEQLLAVGVHVTLQVTLTSKNVRDYKKIIQISKLYGVPIRVTHRLFDPMDISETDLKDMSKLRLPISQVPTNLLQVEKDRPMNDGILKRCKAMRNSFCVSAENHLQLCQRCAFVYEDLYEKDFITALESLRTRLNGFSVPIKCKKCQLSRYCDLCLGGLHKSSVGEIVPYESVCLYARRERDIELMNQEV